MPGEVPDRVDERRQDLSVQPGERQERRGS